MHAAQLWLRKRRGSGGRERLVGSCRVLGNWGMVLFHMACWSPSSGIWVVYPWVPGASWFGWIDLCGGVKGMEWAHTIIQALGVGNIFGLLRASVSSSYHFFISPNEESLYRSPSVPRARAGSLYHTSH